MHTISTATSWDDEECCTAFLQKVASRAIELGDVKLLGHMEQLCLVEKKRKAK